MLNWKSSGLRHRDLNFHATRDLQDRGIGSTGYATVIAQRNGTVVIIKDVPADVCQDCGEAYLDDNVARKIEQQVEEAVHDILKLKFFDMRPEL
uniref:Type II toxin-antitoxin system MqsA family antitoxin n=1 Tax=Leptospirillum ferrodiazotrophum TaxID=412449 RepID=C6I097_9BACT|nr:MAG: hypothetical protein UBAL3_95660007 [Leptospirillum ferrodiazotrophum]